MTQSTTMNKTEKGTGAAFLYEPKSYDALYGMSGFSEEMLSTHFKLYEGYVANTNALMGELAKGDAPEARRRFGWEFNGMRLHEHYFENLGGDGALSAKSPLHQGLSTQFGSFEAWKEDFAAAGAMRGVGWAVLYEDVRAGRFFNVWVEQHNANHLTGGRPILVLDAFEHAYMKDYGVDRKKYIQTFFMNVNWDAVLERAAGNASGAR